MHTGGENAGHTGPMGQAPGRAAQPRPAQLRRQRAGRLVAGVCSGVAEHLGVPVLWVRAVFAALAAFGGAGIAAYALLWVAVPQRAGAERPVSAKERQQGFGLVILGIGLAVWIGWITPLPAWATAPVGVALVGVAVVWREADESQRRRWRQGARDGLLGAGTRASIARVVAGAALAVAAIMFLLTYGATSFDPVAVVLAVLATLAGVAVLTIPWWLRLVRDLNVERASRIRSQERAEIAAHLHDSVLQTLALIQKQADSGKEVRRLAHGQERELRNWLYGPSGYGRVARRDHAGVAATGTALSGELSRICGEIEDAFAIKIQHVVVGDCQLDECARAHLAAAREAIVNAAKHAEVGEVSVYAEVEAEQVGIYVRDRGVGFDPEAVPSDRHGVADSIRGRIERNGGKVRIRTSPGEGTEIEMRMPRS